MRSVRFEPGRTYLRQRSDVEKRYALTTRSPDRPISAELLGPLAPVGLNGSLVFTVDGGPSVALAGEAQPGTPGGCSVAGVGRPDRGGSHT